MYTAALAAGSVTRVTASNERFHVHNEHSGIIYDNNVGLRVRRVRTRLRPFIDRPFVVAGHASTHLNRAIILLTTSTSVRRLGATYRRRLAGCRAPQTFITIGHLPCARANGPTQTRTLQVTRRK